MAKSAQTTHKCFGMGQDALRPLAKPIYLRRGYPVKEKFHKSPLVAERDER